MKKSILITVTFLLLIGVMAPSLASEKQSSILLKNVNIFDGIKEKRMMNANVLIENNIIKEITQKNIDAPKATIPVNVTVRKVVKFGNTPMQLAVVFDYFIEKNDDFGPDYGLKLSITPVVPNFIYEWLQ